ncbi:MAG: hypothetical protein GXP27_11270 [Planctomycetes bacterium]|nr:hypothetical protein [Planctomycetota bacterium]
MRGHGRPVVIAPRLTAAWSIVVCCACLSNPVRTGAGDVSDVRPSPQQDDASLFAVDFVGPRTGWAVGDHGTVWRTIDGGRTWQFLPTPVDCSLRDVCFLTDQVGWIVGGGFEPFTQAAFGVVWHTTDGGRTWKRLDRRRLPMLIAVRFFGPKTGIVVALASPEGSKDRAGVFVTTDGGETWEQLTGELAGSWRGADFIGTGTGVVVGRRGRVGLVGGRKLLPPRVEALGRRDLHDVRLMPNLTGWLVGDGGLVLRTTNGGIVWQEPAHPLPEEVRDVFDFYAVACHKQKAWITGAPGSVIWHTSDGGATWLAQMTGQSLPLYAVDFPTERMGYAVGAMGTILRTEDGGATWQTVRAGRRRAALLAVYPRSSQVSFELLSRYAGDQGYRSVVSVTARDDLGPDGFRRRNSDLQLHQAVLAAGGCVAQIGWQLSLTDLPDLQRSPQTLVAAWLRQTEGRLPDVLIGRLVSELRTWRPSVVVIDQSDPQDASRDILRQAMLAAVGQAADATRWLEHFELAGLSPWQTMRVFVRCPSAEAASVRLDPNQLLPRIGSTPALIAADGYGLLGLPLPAAQPEPYALIWDAHSTESAPAAVRDFWSGLVLAPGSAARRSLPPVDAELVDRKLELARKQRNLAAISDRFLDSPVHSAQLVAHLSDFTDGLSDDRAAVQLLRLANQFIGRHRWDLAETTLMELVRRYPEHPTAGPAMQWLFSYWSSAELAWQRNRKTVAQSSRRQTNRKAVVEEVHQAIQRLAAGESDELTESQRIAQAAAMAPVTQKERAVPWRIAQQTQWQSQAIALTREMQRRFPKLVESPQVQLALAALTRRQGARAGADRIYARLQAEQSGLWKKVADAEIWLVHRKGSPKPYALCRRTPQAPHLDGLLTDACWRDADPMTLRWAYPATADTSEPATGYLARDDQFLYFAAVLPRVKGVPIERPQYEGRRHDADLTQHDRVSLYLDLDRDYSTYYAIHIDQRGWVAESCWQDTGWNPQCYIAVDGDRRQWRVEMALPLTELAPTVPRRQTVWAVGVVRTIPGVGLQSWTPEAGLAPRPESFGLVEFD